MEEKRITFRIFDGVSNNTVAQLFSQYQLPEKGVCLYQFGGKIGTIGVMKQENCKSEIYQIWRQKN